VLVHRDMEGPPARLPALAAELVRLQVDVIVTAGGGPATRAAMQATTTIPIVMAESEEPAGTGLFASQPQPSGNVTGLSTLGPDAMGKRLHLLKDAAPWVSQVAVLYHPPTAATVVGLREAQVAAPEVGLTVLPMAVSTPDEVDAQLASRRQVGADAVLTTAGAFAGVPHRRLLNGAARHQLPTMCAERSAAEAGCLLAYSPSLAAAYWRAAAYVDQILQGVKPAALPVEPPPKFERIINLKTAKALGLTIPAHLLTLATQVLR
jgi:putative ABC transport system substrate-binding protein